MPSFLNPNGTFFPNAPYASVPVTGATVTLPKGATDVYLTPAGTLATLTVKLPPSPMNGVVVSLASSQVVTALTVQSASGAAVANAPTALAVRTYVYFQYLGGVWVTMTNMAAMGMQAA